jgi:hypothetical protein
MPELSVHGADEKTFSAAPLPSCGPTILSRPTRMTVHFLVAGEASPDLPLRVLNLLALRAIAFDAASVERDGDRYRIGVAVSGLEDGVAELLLAKMRALVLVESATLSS